MLLFFDTETTGLPGNWKAPLEDLSNWPRLVQLAWIAFDLDGNELASADTIIRPDGFDIPADASRVHGISTAFARERGTPLIDVLHTFSHQAESMTLVAHNMSFDEKIVGAELLRSGMVNVMSRRPRFCTMTSTTDWCAIPGPYGYKWPSLAELHQKVFGTGFKDAHSATSDVRATASCYWEMKRRKLL